MFVCLYHTDLEKVFDIHWILNLTLEMFLLFKNLFNTSKIVNKNVNLGLSLAKGVKGKKGGKRG
jgi:hypothetical protein